MTIIKDISGKILFKSKKYTLKELCKNKRSDLEGTYLRGANLRGTYLGGAELRGADLRGANLRGANLRGANLEGADLEGAYLEGADLEGADLGGANLRSVDLEGVDLEGANLEGAIISKNIILQENPIIRQLIGYRWPVIFFLSRKEKIMKIGCRVYPLQTWQTFTDEEIKKMDSFGVEDWKKHKHMLFQIAEI